MARLDLRVEREVRAAIARPCDNTMHQKVKARKLLVQFLVLFLAVAAAQAEEKRVLDLKVQNETGSYEVVVTRGDAETALDITLEKPGGGTAKVAHYASFISFVYARPSYPRMDRLVTLWETGSGVTTMIFRLAPPPNRSEIVFNDTSEFEPDFLHDAFLGDLMLFYSGKQFTSSNGLYVPVDAFLYLWSGEKYELVSTVKYANRFDAVMHLEKQKRAELNRAH